MLMKWIATRCGVRYHTQHIPRLLGQLGFSLQRPRKLLARANAVARTEWVEQKLPALLKKVKESGGVLYFEDEVSFWLDGTLYVTWSKKGV
jgi:hypothetical protein